MQTKITQRGINIDIDRTDLLNIRSEIENMMFAKIDGKYAICIHAFRIPLKSVRAAIDDPRNLLDVVKK